MLRRHLDVAVFQPVIDLVLDAQVGKVDLVLEVREVMFERPLTDFVGRPIGVAVVVVTVPITLVEPLLVLTLELVVEDDAFDARAAWVGVARPFVTRAISALRTTRQAGREQPPNRVRGRRLGKTGGLFTPRFLCRR